jgi:hypothetical protein
MTTARPVTDAIVEIDLADARQMVGDHHLKMLPVRLFVAGLDSGGGTAPGREFDACSRAGWAHSAAGVTGPLADVPHL